ncbi:MAG TPA: BrnT family toxin [Candidatus Acidoferrum sp.]|nr:BrnT family toxin [Candidatus Acidoferrum sp.]
MHVAWDPRKAVANLKKHKIAFEEASTALADPLAITGADPDHSVGESRWITFGLSNRWRLLAVAHTDQDDLIHLISARAATRAERRLYEEG